MLGDWGDVTNAGAEQAVLMQRIAQTGARFALTTGDNAYPSGSQSNYGDLVQTGGSLSGVFGPQFWTVPGRSMALFPSLGNHGMTNSDTNHPHLINWPQLMASQLSAGRYLKEPYSGIDGTNPANYPSTWYAFNAGNIRYYVLKAAWADTNIGTASSTYQVDRDYHWAPGRPEYQWLIADLAAHASTPKIAFFHYPLYSDNKAEKSDTFLNGMSNLEGVLINNGVKLIFNGHGHIYQRSATNGIASYTVGATGVKLAPLDNGCAPTTAYALGWSNSRNRGYACGSATVPTSKSQVYSFAQVSVNGNTVTVSPINALGQTFDQRVYDFAAGSGDTTPPSVPATLVATASSATNVNLTWSASTDNIGVINYEIERNGTPLTTVGAVTSHADNTVSAATAYAYRVRARDAAGNVSGWSTVANATTPTGGDTTPPSVPATLVATASSATNINLTWSASTDNIGVTNYEIERNGTPLTTVGAVTSHADNTVSAATAYAYRVRARDAAGNVSGWSTVANATTPTGGDTTPPSVPANLVATASSATNVNLTWSASTDNIGVTNYEIERNGTPLTTVGAVTSHADNTVSAATAYAYRVRARDAAGNVSGWSTVANATTPGGGPPIFQDGLESGNLSAWTSSGGLTVQSAVIHSGVFAAQGNTTVGATYAKKTLPSTYADGYARVYFNLISAVHQVNLLRFRTAADGSIGYLFVNTAGNLALRNDVGAVTLTSATSVSSGWHALELRMAINGASGLTEVWLDGVRINDLSVTTNLGSTAIGRLQIGEVQNGRTYNVILDDAAFNSVRVGP